jgi:predicted Rossmann fold nucleotide-binding protein DprA/Smf involved in DNA uptake
VEIGSQAQAILLLTVPFARSPENGPKPLSPSEWAKFSLWLKDHDLQPASLLNQDLGRRLAGWMDHSVTRHRLEHLLGRGAALGLAVEKWQRAGLFVLTRSDADYPERLKQRLKFAAPPVLFGCGNKALLGCGGVAIVGSRDATDEDLEFASGVGSDAAAQGYAIISGGARGVDQSAMLGALERAGTAVGVIADGLLRSALSAKYRRYLLSGDLVLVSPFNPEAGFNVGNAMARNRYIYGLSDAAIVVSSRFEQGGTWNGAIENLRSRWVPLWVKQSFDPESGNAELVRCGGRWLPDAGSALGALITADEHEADRSPSVAERPEIAAAADRSRSSDGAGAAALPLVRREEQEPTEAVPALLDGLSFYALFLHRVHSLTAANALTVDEIARHLGLCKTQITTWLQQAVAEGRMAKLTRPVRYQAASSIPRQPSMFPDAERHAPGI